MEPEMRDPQKDFKEGYALSGKIMLSAIVVLFFVIILMVCLHLYARWYLIRARQRHTRRHRNRTNLVFLRRLCPEPYHCHYSSHTWP
ncbi:hypothetical protein OIU84_018391 [Salix udensis]|uniref:Uncharacterized protein n=1 Tax=Salix udensis TaxID=889485 RepID=A0AAD6KWN1_9ROSI|nr:hypothetical protein OIU84_018391 [Salix udensis]